MIAYRAPTGLSQLRSFLASMLYQGQLETRRLKRAQFSRLAFGAAAAGTAGIEMVLAASMFSAYAPNIGDYSISGFTLGMLVPILLIAAHLKIYYDADFFTKAWLRIASTIGIFLLAIGISSMISLAFLDAARVKGALSSGGGLQGQMGDTTLGSGDTSLIDLVYSLASPLPPVLLFIGLALSLLVTTYVVHFFLARAVEAHQIIQHQPSRPPGFWETCRGMQVLIREASDLQDQLQSALRLLPADPEHSYARKAFRYVAGVVSTKRRAGDRVFSKDWGMSPLNGTLRDTESFPSTITSQADVDRAGGDILDGIRVHHVVSILSAYQKEGTPS